MPEQPRPVYLHLGLQKTGTTYLQGVMQRNVERLAGMGLDVVPPTRREAFELMLLVRGRYNPERDPRSVAGALDRFSARLGRSPGSRAVLSQESLAAARPPQVRRLLEACRDREPHVVLTVRDLARQLPSAWQQELKAGKTVGYQAFLGKLRHAQQEGRTGHPWIQLDPPAVLARWADEIPAERIHVVTVPPPGSPPTLLLERFCRVLDVEPSGLVPLERARNTSLGGVQAELLRRVNAELPEELKRRQVYGGFGKRFFASQVLGGQDASRILVPEQFKEWCLEVTAAQRQQLAQYDVVGTLEDLHCDDAAFGEGAGPLQEADVAASAVSALAEILAARGAEAQRRRSRPGRRRTWKRRVRRLAGRPPVADVVPEDDQS